MGVVVYQQGIDLCLCGFVVIFFQEEGYWYFFVWYVEGCVFFVGEVEQQDFFVVVQMVGLLVGWCGLEVMFVEIGGQEWEVFGQLGVVVVVGKVDLGLLVVIEWVECYWCEVVVGVVYWFVEFFCGWYWCVDDFGGVGVVWKLVIFGWIGYVVIYEIGVVW